MKATLPILLSVLSVGLALEAEPKKTSGGGAYSVQGASSSAGYGSSSTAKTGSGSSSSSTTGKMASTKGSTSYGTTSRTTYSGSHRGGVREGRDYREHSRVGYRAGERGFGYGAGVRTAALVAESIPAVYGASETYGAKYVPRDYSVAKRYVPAAVEYQQEAPAVRRVEAYQREAAYVPAAVKTVEAISTVSVLQEGKPACGINPLRTCNAEQLAAQRAFFAGEFQGHPWGYWFDNYFPFFIGVFPFLFHLEHDYYPPLYYDFYSCTGKYPQAIEHFEEYRTKVLPWPTIAGGKRLIERTYTTGRDTGYADRGVYATGAAYGTGLGTSTQGGAIETYAAGRDSGYATGLGTAALGGLVGSQVVGVRSGGLYKRAGYERGGYAHGGGYQKQGRYAHEGRQAGGYKQSSSSSTSYGSKSSSSSGSKSYGSISSGSGKSGGY